MYEGLSLSLRPIKKQAALKLALFHLAFFCLKKKDRRLYVCRDKIGRGEKIVCQDLELNVNSKIIKKGFRDLRR